jgi:two-component sensor histidine kinase
MDWAVFTGRLGVTQTAGEISRELAEYGVHATGASVAVYLASDAGYRLAAAHGPVSFVPVLGRPSGVSWLSAPSAVPADMLSSLIRPAPETALAVPIRWRTSLLGFMVFAPYEPGGDNGFETVRTLEAAAAQAAAWIMALGASGGEASHPPTDPAPWTIATIVHDLKNTTAALSLLAKNLASHAPSPEFQRDAVRTLSGTVARMRRLLGRLGPSAPEPPRPRSEAIDLRELIIEATTPFAVDGRVRLVRRLDEVDRVYADREALLRVVENLATNATEAIEREGTVTVTLAEEQGHAVISVADTGCGISDEYREHHLFHPGRSTKSGGWGLGLYQTKRAVESQSGEISVRSVEGHGTTFTVRLPMQVVPLENAR